MNQGEFSFLLALHEALQNQQVVSLGLLSNYYNWKSAMSLWMCVILCVRFKTGVSISHNHLVFPKGCPSIFQSKIFWRLILQYSPTLAWVAPWVFESLHSFVRNFAVVLSSYFWVSYILRLWDLTISCLLHFNLSYCYSFYILSHRGSFLSPIVAS